MVKGRKKLLKVKKAKKTGNQLDDTQRASIITAHSYGESSVVIAKTMNRGIQTIRDIIHKINIKHGFICPTLYINT